MSTHRGQPRGRHQARRSRSSASRFVDGGEAAVAASTDPMIVAAHAGRIRSRANTSAGMHEDVQRVNAGRRETGQGALPGLREGRLSRRDLYLRLSYGTVKGYPIQRDHRSAIHHVLRTLRSRRGLRKQASVQSHSQGSGRTADKLDLATPLDFVIHGRHHRRKLGFAGGQPRRRTRRP